MQPLATRASQRCSSAQQGTRSPPRRAAPSRRPLLRPCACHRRRARAVLRAKTRRRHPPLRAAPRRLSATRCSRTTRPWRLTARGRPARRRLPVGAAHCPRRCCRRPPRARPTRACIATRARTRVQRAASLPRLRPLGRQAAHRRARAATPLAATPLAATVRCFTPTPRTVRLLPTTMGPRAPSPCASTSSPVLTLLKRTRTGRAAGAAPAPAPSHPQRRTTPPAGVAGLSTPTWAASPLWHARPCFRRRPRCGEAACSQRRGRLRCTRAAERGRGRRRQRGPAEIQPRQGGRLSRWVRSSHARGS